MIDVQTGPKRGGTSVKCLDVPDTEVYYGYLHARVEMRDLNVAVLMDPTEGRWHDREWARARAMVVLCTPGVIELVLPRMAKIHLAIGHKAGRDELQHEFGELLGLYR